MSGNAFVSSHVPLEVGFDDARDRLVLLARDGLLLAESAGTYRQGIAGLAPEAGLVARLCRLSRVRCGEVETARGCARLSLRWEAAGPGIAVFPALDADLTLCPAEDVATVLALTGIYRLPDRMAADLEPAVVRRQAEVTVRSFIARVASALAHPAGTALR
jgi:hypothetical protein